MAKTKADLELALRRLEFEVRSKARTVERLSAEVFELRWRLGETGAPAPAPPSPRQPGPPHFVQAYRARLKAETRSRKPNHA